MVMHIKHDDLILNQYGSVFLMSEVARCIH